MLVAIYKLRNLWHIYFNEQEGRIIMDSYVCTVCGYVYEEENGYPEGGIAPGTKWEDVPDDFVCPMCGATKDMFEKQ